MDRIYVSLPKRKRVYPNGGDEIFWMNKIADQLQRELLLSPIETIISPQEVGLPAVIRQSNALGVSLHIALRSAESEAMRKGMQKGACVFYYEHDDKGKKYAKLLADCYREIYPEPSLVRTSAVTAWDELRKTRAISLLVETAYHDNPQDEIWLTNSTAIIAKALAKGIHQIFNASKKQNLTE